MGICGTGEIHRQLVRRSGGCCEPGWTQAVCGARGNGRRDLSLLNAKRPIAGLSKLAPSKMFAALDFVRPLRRGRTSRHVIPEYARLPDMTRHEVNNTDLKITRESIA